MDVTVHYCRMCIHTFSKCFTFPLGVCRAHKMYEYYYTALFDPEKNICYIILCSWFNLNRDLHFPEPKFYKLRFSPVAEYLEMQINNAVLKRANSEVLLLVFFAECPSTSSNIDKFCIKSAEMYTPIYSEDIFQNPKLFFPILYKSLTLTSVYCRQRLQCSHTTDITLQISCNRYHIADITLHSVKNNFSLYLIKF